MLLVQQRIREHILPRGKKAPKEKSTADGTQKQSNCNDFSFILKLKNQKPHTNRDLPHFTISLDGKSAIKSITQITQSRASYNPPNISQKLSNYKANRQKCRRNPLTLTFILLETVSSIYRPSLSCLPIFNCLIILRLHFNYWIELIAYWMRWNKSTEIQFIRCLSIVCFHVY